MRKQRIIPLLLSLLLMASCQEAEEEYARNECHFTFNCTYHNTSRLLDAVNSYETYAIVTTKPMTGKTYTVVTSIYGTDDTEDKITTDLETQQRHVLGLSNGLIIGKSSMDQTLYAFDRQCPNCFAASNMTSAPLQWAGNSTTVKCGKCGRTYNLANRGVVASGEAGQSLMRYRIVYDGTYITVYN